MSGPRHQSVFFDTYESSQRNRNSCARYNTQRLLAELAQVRASTHGILDGESQNGSLLELDTASDPEGDGESRPTRLPAKRKSRMPKKRTRKESKPTSDMEIDEQPFDHVRTVIDQIAIQECH